MLDFSPIPVETAIGAFLLAFPALFSIVNPPGGALIFELWKHGGEQGTYYVRASYVTQSLDQLREATPLTMDAPPSLSPIFIPGCSVRNATFDCPLANFVTVAKQVIDQRSADRTDTDH